MFPVFKFTVICFGGTVSALTFNGKLSSVLNALTEMSELCDFDHWIFGQRVSEGNFQI